ncbi:hypothetical protein Q5P01_000794 [Channa striata]|uniref:Uncharacterized protein n=1 Tax=Channa striata TaxID=64152 RepID=A0AA88IKL9_CHASR|nr:hypothetical protein Q5P01_000794 [Channa striata]
MISQEELDAIAVYSAARQDRALVDRARGERQRSLRCLHGGLGQRVRVHLERTLRTMEANVFLSESESPRVSHRAVLPPALAPAPNPSTLKFAPVSLQRSAASSKLSSASLLQVENTSKEL